MWIQKLPFFLLGIVPTLYALCYAHHVLHPSKGRERKKANKKAAAGAWLLAAANLMLIIIFLIFI